MKKSTNPKGFIMVLAMVTTVVVTGGAILLGSAVIDNVHKQGCGSSLSAWQSGDIYGDLADADNSDALDAALKCQKSVHDAVQTAKPVATLISSAGNIGGGADNLATVGVDRMMDLTDNLSNPEHRHPVRDALLPPAITAKIDEYMEEDKPEGLEEELPVNDEVTEEPEEPSEVELESDEDDDATPTPQELPKPVVEEVIEEVVEKKEEEGNPFAGTYVASFSRPNTQVITEEGIQAITTETTHGSISITFDKNGNAYCDTQLKTDFSTELSIEGIPPATGSGSARSTNCNGDIGNSGTFLLFGQISGSITVSGETVEDEGDITITGYIDSNGKMLGSISIDGVPDVPFQQ